MNKKQETTLTIIELAIRKLQSHIREAQFYAEEAQSAATCSPVPDHYLADSIGDIITQLQLIDQQADEVLLNIVNPSVK